MDRFKETKKAGILGIIGNVFLLIIKSFVGFISHSQAMIADAANSAGDIFASLMTFVGNKIASEPNDDSHNFGHGKAEYIFSLFIAISMILVGFKLFYDSIISLLNRNVVQFSWWLIIVCIVTIVIKLLLYLYTSLLIQKYNNILLIANQKDHRNDCIVTTFTLVSVFLSKLGIFWFDGIVGMGISVWICFTGLKIFVESYNILMDISIDSDTKNTILKLSEKYTGIEKIENLSSTPVGYQYLIVLTIDVDGNMSTFDSHKLADDLENAIRRLDNIYDVIIHVNPV